VEERVKVGGIEEEGRELVVKRRSELYKISWTFFSFTGADSRA